MRLFRFIFYVIIAAFVWSVVSGNITAGEIGRLSSAATEKANRFLHLSEAVKSRLASQPGNYTTINEIPLALQQALIATEDARFYHHRGIDLEGIGRAMMNDLQDGQFTEGGSTITQQLAKNLFLSHEKTMGRKVEEIALAIQIEMRFNKDEILEMYLNSIYYGSGANGITAAADIYFAKPVKDLNLAESAILAGLPQAPSAYSPYVDFAAAKQRQAIVLDLMAKQGFISPNAAAKAKSEPLRLAK